MTTRRLAAILAADVVGFSSMMEKDEEGTLRRLKATQRDIIEPRVRMAALGYCSCGLAKSGVGKRMGSSCTVFWPTNLGEEATAR